MKDIVLLITILLSIGYQHQQVQKANVPFVIITTVDTKFYKGSLDYEHTIGLKDLEIFHGHLYDCLIVGFQGLTEVLKVLHPVGIFDGINPRIVSKPSPCLTDAAIYSSVERYPFKTFYVSAEIMDLFILQRVDNNRAVIVHLHKGLKHEEIDQLGNLAVESTTGGCHLDTFNRIEDKFSAKMLNSNSLEHFIVREISIFCVSQF